MIQEFKVKNYRSIASEQTLSFEATEDTLGEDYQVKTMTDGTRLLRFAAIFGANASGKSNILKALNFVLDFIKSDKDVKKDESVDDDIAPFKFSGEYRSRNSVFSLTFYERDKKFKYELEVNRHVVAFEKLEIYKSEGPSYIFKRELIDGETVIEFNPSLNIDSQLESDFKRYTLKNISVFNALHYVNSGIDEMEEIFRHLRLDNSASITSILGTPDKKPFVLKIIKEADLNISDINIKKEKFPDEFITHVMDSKEISPEIKKRISESPFNTRVSFSHYAIDANGNEDYEEMEDDDESKGTLNAVGFSALIYDVLKNNSFFTDDEFERSFHPELMKKLIYDFLNQGNSTSQLLITTHYDPLMEEIDKGNLRPDSFWFTEKKKDASTELYALTDFNGINTLSSIREAYRTGQLGALPNIN